MQPKQGVALRACSIAAVLASLAWAGASAQTVTLPSSFSDGWAKVEAAPLKAMPGRSPASRSLSLGDARPMPRPDLFSQSWAAAAEKPLKAANASGPSASDGAATPSPLPALITSGTPGPQPSSGMSTNVAAYVTPDVPVAPSAPMAMPLPRPPEIGGGLPPMDGTTQVAMLGGPGAGVEIGRLAVMTKLPPIANGACSVEDPYKVTAVGLNGRVALSPPATLDAEMVKHLEQWEARVQAAAQKHLGEPVTALHVAGSYDCRPRNHVFGARLSEHGLANALDISEFRTGSGKKITVERDFYDPGARGEFLHDVHQATCDVFKTVLGPGSDGAHENHFHMDLGRSKICR